MFICGNYTKNNKSCKFCKQFMLWGISTGYCCKHKKDIQTLDHCKYFKRDSTIWNKNGKCKIDENLLYM